MSSPKAQTSKAPAKAAPKKAAASKARSSEPSKSEKAAFLKAMVQGIKPGSLAAEKSAAKKNPAQNPVAKPAGKKSAAQTAEAPKVEILRKISGAGSIPVSPESAKALAFAKEIEAALADGKIEQLQPHAVQALVGALCKYYAANEDAGNRYPILSGRGAVTGTDVMIVCGALLKAVDLQVFELGMWQSWAGR